MNMKTPRYNDISEILGGGYGFGLGNPHLAAAAVAAAAMNGYGDHSYLSGDHAGAVDPRRFGGISPAAAFYGASSLPDTMAKLNMQVSSSCTTPIDLHWQALTMGAVFVVQSPLGYYDPALRGSTPSSYLEALGFESPLFPKSPEEAAWAQKQQQQQLAAFYGLAAGATAFPDRLTPAGFFHGGYPPAGAAAAAAAPSYGKVPMPCSPRSYNASNGSSNSNSSNNITTTTSNNTNQQQVQSNTGGVRMETVS